MIKTVSVLVCLMSLEICSTTMADTPLELSMKQMGKAYKQLSLDLQQPQDAQKDDYVALAATMKLAAQKSRTLVPKKVAELPPDQQAVMVKDYQKAMDDLIASIDVLSANLQGGRWDNATKQLAMLKQQMMVGHKEFRKKDK